jgi:hypothetical protein
VAGWGDLRSAYEALLAARVRSAGACDKLIVDLEVNLTSVDVLTSIALGLILLVLRQPDYCTRGAGCRASSHLLVCSWSNATMISSTRTSCSATLTRSRCTRSITSTAVRPAHRQPRGAPVVEERLISNKAITSLVLSLRTCFTNALVLLVALVVW